MVTPVRDAGVRPDRVDAGPLGTIVEITPMTPELRAALETFLMGLRDAGRLGVLVDVLEGYRRGPKSTSECVRELEILFQLQQGV